MKLRDAKPGMKVRIKGMKQVAQITWVAPPKDNGAVAVRPKLCGFHYWNAKDLERAPATASEKQT